jgi:hypothetical protein
MNKLGIATMAAFGIVGTALAQQPGQQAAQGPQQPTRSEQPAGDDRTDQVTFETADKNKDGVVNREEGNAIDGFDYSRADTNEDELVSRQEFQTAMATSTPRDDGQPELREGDRTTPVSFDRADTNRDGAISNEEANEIPGFNFSRADVNDDEQLSRQEFQSAMGSSQPGV